MINVKDIFADPGETEIAQLNSGSIAPGGTLTAHYCVFSEKRLYHRGMAFTSGAGKTLAANENIVNLKDISCTGFTSQKKISYLLSAIFFLLISITTAIFLITDWETTHEILLPCGIGAIVISILMFVLYFVIRRKVFSIYFAGGELSFLANGCRIKTLRAFNQALHIAIEKACEQAKAPAQETEEVAEQTEVEEAPAV